MPFAQLLLDTHAREKFIVLSHQLRPVVERRIDLSDNDIVEIDGVRIEEGAYASTEGFTFPLTYFVTVSSGDGEKTNSFLTLQGFMTVRRDHVAAFRKQPATSPNAPVFDSTWTPNFGMMAPST